jgi:hypothetical protein
MDALNTTQPDLTLVALSPTDIPAAQAEIAEWCRRKIHELQVQRSDFIDNARIAAEHQWQFRSLEAAAKRCERTISYYEKIAAAVSEGFLIVPNFDVEVIAVRTDRRKPNRNEPHEARARLLPVGEGRYVDDKPHIRTEAYQATDYQNKPVTRTRDLATRFDENLDFPVLAVKPIVMEATARAMAFKIFDRIGVVTGKREDPVVVGQIIDPRHPYRYQGRPKVVTFFVAWWLDSRTL